MRHVFISGCTLVLAFGLMLPAVTRADSSDLSISASSIRFSEDTLYAGATVRIYATIKNLGDFDSTAQVFFYSSDQLIGKSQAISVLANGSSDDVFVDYKLPDGSFNIRAVIQGANPTDGNASNDVAITPLFKTIADDDRDGILNDADNCVSEANADQANLDGDPRGDVCDSDIDNDGTNNDDDAFPNDPSKTKITPTPVPPKPEPAPVTTPTPVAAPVVSPAPAPSPVVAGATDETTEPAPTDDALALDLSGLGSGTPITSPAARFTYRQIDWRTYEFTAMPSLGGGDYTFAWDFGDGATSVQPTITHAFPASGSYKITLASVAADGTVTSDAQQLSVSFFHLANPLLLGTLAVLLVIIIGLLVLIRRLRRGEEV